MRHEIKAEKLPLHSPAGHDHSKCCHLPIQLNLSAAAELNMSNQCHSFRSESLEVSETTALLGKTASLAFQLDGVDRGALFVLNRLKSGVGKLENDHGHCVHVELQT